MNRHPRGKSIDVQPHPQGELLRAHAVPRALKLASIVRTEGAWDVAQLTDPLDRDALIALCVVLAAMVDIDKTPRELLAWLDEPLDRRDAA